MAFDLKDEGEVKEYLENLGTEYRFGCYHEKKPEGNLKVVLIILTRYKNIIKFGIVGFIAL